VITNPKTAALQLAKYAEAGAEVSIN
jgi:hypothetical protein